jgi:ethanolamine kinase
LEQENSVLVRVFGAEGMIDRDVEATTLAALVEAQLAVPYHGRFANGRLEQWLEGYRALEVHEMGQSMYSQPICSRMARLHQFQLPVSLSSSSSSSTQPSMWSQLDSWMEQAQSISHYTTPGDDDRAARLLNLPNICEEIHWLKHDVVPEKAKVAFCHNDLLAGNIMVQTTTTSSLSETDENGMVQLIDFEYGGVNYAAFDIANHFNEFAGGTSVEENGVTDYTRFPSPAQQEAFLRTYLQASSSLSSIDPMELESLQAEVTAFVLSNHLYWGLWGVNQAAQEGTSEFDYLTYASNRFQQYYVTKKSQRQQKSPQTKT